MSGGRDSREQDCAFRETVSAQALQQRFCHHPQRPVELNVGIDAVNGPGMDTFSSGTATGNPAFQHILLENDQIDVLLAKGVKALAINLVDPAAAGTVIEKARGQNVPVVFFNKEPSRKALDSYDKAYYVGTDSKESGIIQGDLIAKHWAANQGWDLNKDGQIQFVLLKGEPGHPDAEARTTYVIKELNDKGIKTEQLQLDTAMWDTAQAKDKMDAWLSGPNANKIEVVIANNDAMAMGAVEALKAHNKSSIPVFGVDALPEALALVKSGALAGTVLNDANNQAKATFDLAKNLADGKGAADGTNWKIDNKVVRVPYVGVDKDNLAEFSKK
ncbi:sugar ABC transporter substrate-binding protein [Escherichia coli Nissle 1917]|nr:sugar ABC transporter substrate-binding protein [Escherichia coli Nissle 1917]